MDYIVNGRRPVSRNRFGSVTGTIVDMIPTRQGNGRTNGCVTFVEMEDMDGNTVHFVLTPAVYVLVNEDNTLQLNLDGTVEVRTTNNQYFQGSPANHNLAVIYGNSTRSIPAQTTPMKVVVLCE